ncbi:MAG: DUF4153 domain-containing protein [Bdellovibrionales bacterium]|nr:DUF4153 domain-containing protein [Bdellovibrionales bacterium]
MQKVLKSIFGLFKQFADTSKRYPATCFVAFVALSRAVFMSEFELELGESSAMFTIMLGLPLMFAVESTIAVRKLNGIKQSWPYYLGGVVFLGLHYMYVLGDNSQNFVMRYIQVSLVVHLLVSFLPFASLKKETSFWSFNALLIMRFIEAFIYAVVLFIGLALALLSVDKLLGIDVYEKLYLWIWFFSALFFHPILFLGKLPKDFSSALDELKYPTGLQYFVQYLLIPLVTLFTLILYLYMAKILVTLTWPKGYLGWLVSIISVLGVLNLLLLDPLQKSIDWIKGYAKVFYIAMFPLLIMLFVAVFKRIEAYGVTEKRYALFSLGGLLVFIMLYFLLSKTKNIKVIPVTLSLTLLLTLFGPWSAYSVSRRSQMALVEALLIKNGLLENGKAKPSEKVEIDHEQAKRITNILDYLVKNHEPKHLEVWFSKEVLDSVWASSLVVDYTGYRGRFRKSSHALVEYMGVPYTTRWSYDSFRNFTINHPTAPAVVPIAGDYTHAIKHDLYSDSEYSRAAGDLPYGLKFKRGEDYSFEVGKTDQLQQVDLKALAQKWLAVPFDERDQIPMKDFELILGEGCNCKLIFHSLRGEKDRNSIRITGVNFTLLVKE